MNRKQRRDARKALPAYKRNMTKEQRINALIKNGITPDEVQREYDHGRVDGYKEGCEDSLYKLYACACLTLNELHGFGAKRNMAFLELLHEKILFCLDHDEAIQEVYDRMNLRIDFRNSETPFKEAKKVVV